MFGPNLSMILVSFISALVYSGQVGYVVQKVNELLHWKLGCNPIPPVGNVSLHYFNGRGKGEAIRLLMEDQNIPYTETRYTQELWANAQPLGIEDGLYHFGEIPSIETIKGVRLSKRKSILHFIGRSVGLDCDCHEIDWCDMVATAVDDLQKQLENTVFTQPKFDPFIRDSYAKNILIPWLGYFEKLPESKDTNYEDEIYFAGGRLTWLDYSIFDMLESNCNLLDYTEGWDVPSHLNCSTVFEMFPRLDRHYNTFKSRLNIHEYVNSERRTSYGPPFW